VNEAIAQYCENCGQPLDSKASFCPSCGHAVPQDSPAPAGASPPAPPAPPAPATRPATAPRPSAAARPAVTSQPSETVVAVLPPATRRSGFLGLKSQAYVLVLTDTRILFAQQTSKMVKENARQAREAAKQSGQGLLGQWGAVIDSNSSGQRYLQMHPQQILAETAENFAVTNNQVRSARIRTQEDDDRGTSEVVLTLKTVGGKAVYTYRQSSERDIKRVLRQTLGDMVR